MISFSSSGFFGRLIRVTSKSPSSRRTSCPGRFLKPPTDLAFVTIEIKEGKKSSQRYKDIVEVTGGRLTPEWIEADLEALKGVVKERPTREMIDVPVDEVQIVELYSK